MWTTYEIWPLPISVGFMYSPSWIHSPRSTNMYFLSYHVYKVFIPKTYVDCNDLWPPPTSIGFFVCTKQEPYTMYEVQQRWTFELSCLHSFQILNFTEKNRVIVLNEMCTYTMYDCRVMVFTSKCHKHMASPSHRSLMPPARHQHVLWKTLQWMYVTKDTYFLRS